MNRQAAPTSTPVIAVPRVPAWATPRGPVQSDVDAAYMAGSALNSLDNLARSDAPWLGAWRQRLALKAAAATVRLMRRTEDESALRDVWYLRQPGEEPGPAGNVLAAWRELAGRRLPPSAEDFRSIADRLGVRWSEAFADKIQPAGDAAHVPAPLLAAGAATAIMQADPQAEALAWWVADLTLSWRLGWSPSVPILASQIHAPALRTGPDRRRGRPGGPDFALAVCVAAASGAAEACQIASGIAQKAQRLDAVKPKLRSRAAAEVIALLLSDDAVSGSFTSRATTRWASRRLFGRLRELGAVRELTGRPTFRLYGL